MEEVNRKIITKRILATIAMSFVVGGYPPFSLFFFLLTLSIGSLSTITGIYGNYRQNKELTLIYNITSNMMISLLLGLRFWDVSIGLSWLLILSLLPWLIWTIVLPSINKNLSEFLYREQFTPQTKVGRFLYILALSVAPTIGVLGASLGKQLNVSENGTFLVVLGFLLYMGFVAVVLNSFYMYKNDRFTWRQEKSRLRNSDV